ncbi:MAG TPA: hypothetical protein VFZ33_00490 [Chitinophagaceae bacterium]
MLLVETIFAPLMKKLIAIFFFSLLGLHFATAFSGLSQQAVICMDIEEKNSNKSKDTIKEMPEENDFENDRLSCYDSLAQQIIHHAVVNFCLQHPIIDIPTPPPNHC